MGSGNASIRQEPPALRASAPAFRMPGPLAPATTLLGHRGPIAQLTRREILGRYRGSVLGLLWSLATPLLMLVVFTLVFGIALRGRWAERVPEAGSRGEFAVVLFAGLILFWFFSECLTRAPNLLMENADYVRGIVFPLEVLAFVVLGSALFHLAVSLGVLLVAQVLFLGAPPWTALLFPLVLLPFVLLVLGLTWFLASLGVFVRDVGHGIGIAMSIAMFLSPIFYPATVFPEPARWLLRLNPLTFPIAQARNVLLWGRAPDWAGLGIYLSVGWLVAWLGLAWFLKSRRAFADVL